MEQKTIDDVYKYLLGVNSTTLLVSSTLINDVNKFVALIQLYIANQIPIVVQTLTSPDGTNINQYGLFAESYYPVLGLYPIYDINGDFFSNLILLRDNFGNDTLYNGTFYDNDTVNWLDEIKSQVPYVNDTADGYLYITDTQLLEILYSITIPDIKTNWI